VNSRNPSRHSARHRRRVTRSVRLYQIHTRSRERLANLLVPSAGRGREYHEPKVSKHYGCATTHSPRPSGEPSSPRSSNRQGVLAGSVYLNLNCLRSIPRRLFLRRSPSTSTPIPATKLTNGRVNSRSTNRFTRSMLCSISGTSRQRLTSKCRALKERLICFDTTNTLTNWTQPIRHPARKQLP
jgi:hypothetical protein